jgi:enterochelin esterase-like enzyme
MIRFKNYRKISLLVLALFFSSLLTACGGGDSIDMGSLASAAGTSKTSPAPAQSTTVNTGAAAKTTTGNTTNSSTAAPVATPSANTPTVKPANPAAPSPTAYPTPKLNIPLVGPELTVEFDGKGQVFERQFYSNDLKKNVSYRIYLPQGYNSSQKRYPVLYMLHGFSGRIDEWMWYGIMGRVDDLISSGKIKPFLIVLPEGDQEYWVDHPNDGPKWGDYTAHEVVDHIDGNYRTIPLKESRAVGGLSMGATGALQIAMNYPGIFGVVGAHSPAMRTYDQKLPWWGDQAWFNQTDPVTLAKTSDALYSVKLWIDIGANDSAWGPRMKELKQVLDERKIPFIYTEWPGDHNADYWTAHMVDYLNFYASALSFG